MSERSAFASKQEFTREGKRLDVEPRSIEPREAFVIPKTPKQMNGRQAIQIAPTIRKKQSEYGNQKK
jgi:hypothetical protein